jgi:hypothetical protein
MTLRKRYTLIVLGFLIFSVAAPFFVLSIRGYVFDLESRQFVKTGILVAKTQPKGAIVELAGPENLKTKTNKAIRFLTPGDYQVTVSKENFVTWQKTLSIKGGLVNSLGQDYLYLLPQSLIPTDPATRPAVPTALADNYFFTATDQGNLNLVRQTGTGQTIVLLENVPPADERVIYVTPDGLVFLILDRTLYRVNPEVSPSPDIQTGLKFIGSGVDFVEWHKTLGKLVFGSPHELVLHNPFDPEQTTELVERTSEAGGDFCFLKDLGYAFRLYGNRLKAIELDGRSQRNTHVYELNTPAQSIYCQDQNKTVSLVQADGSVQTYRFNFGSVLGLWPR